MSGAQSQLNWVWWVALGAIPVAVVALWSYLRLGQRMARPVAVEMAGFDAKQVRADALQSFRFVWRRTWSALIRGMLLLSLYAAAIVVVGGGVLVLAAWKQLPDIALSLGWWETLPGVARYAGYFLGLGLAALVLVGTLYQFRILTRVRDGKWLRWRELGEELDTAIGHGGILSTLAFGGVLAVASAGWLSGWALAGSAVAEALGGRSVTGVLVGLAGACVVGWFLCMPVIFTFAVMAIRDPGWLSAVEASIGVAVFRRRETFKTAAYATSLATSVYYWPVAIWMALDIIEQQELLVTVLLRERRPEDVARQIGEMTPAREGSLRRADQFLRNGRFLDALNLYQMVAFKDPMEARALEGIARAQLHIGNRLKAKEALERLLMLDSTHEAGVRMMTELQTGLWNEGGELFEEAKRRCTQALGKGVELRDTLDPALLREFEK